MRSALATGRDCAGLLWPTGALALQVSDTQLLGLGMEIRLTKQHCGPASMGHGGYVAGLFADRSGDEAIQVTLRRPCPFDTPLQLVEQSPGRFQLLDGETLIAEAEPAPLQLEVPPAPSLEEAIAAEPKSPSFYNQRGVHPSCFGCSNGRAQGDGLRVFVGPVEGRPLVAGRFSPPSNFTDASGLVRPLFVLAALDCPGAFAFIVDRKRAGLLGRIVFKQHAEVHGGQDYIVSGWQAGEDGRKLFAGTALFDTEGRLLAAAHATWFQMKPR